MESQNVTITCLVSFFVGGVVMYYVLYKFTRKPVSELHKALYVSMFLKVHKPMKTRKKIIHRPSL